MYGNVEKIVADRENFPFRPLYGSSPMVNIHTSPSSLSRTT